MNKPLAYFCLILIGVGILGVDYLILTTSGALSNLVAREIKNALGDSIDFGSVDASLSSVSLRSVAFRATQKRIRVLAADRIDVAVSRRAGAFVPTEVTLVAPRLTLNADFIEQIQKEPASRPLRELYPPDALPRIRMRGGQIELVGKPILNWSTPQILTIEDLALVPVSGYRYFVGGRLKSALLGEWRLSGEFDLDTGAIHLSFSSDAVTIGPKVRQVLAPEIHEQWDRYSPDGTARVRVLVDADAGEPVRFRATVAPIDMKICYAGFPYAVERARGELDFFANKVVVKHLEGWHGNTRIRFDGQANGYEAEADYDFRIEIDGMPFDESLRAALKPEARKVYDAFGPSGLLDARGRVTREYGPDKPTRNPLDIRVRGATFRYRPFPFELTDVEGEIHVDVPFARVKLLTGVHGDSRFSIHGVLDNLEDDPIVDLRIRGQNLALDPTLKHALPPEALKTWEKFDPSGAIDIEWHVTKKKGEKDVHRGEAIVRTGRTKFRPVPLPISDVTGHVVYGPDVVVMNHMAGKLDTGTVTLSGRVETPADEPAIHSYDIAAVGARVDDRFKKAMPKQIADLLDTLRLTGLVNFQLHLDMKGAGETEEMQWRLRLDLRGAGIDTAVRFDDIQGTVDFIGSIVKGRNTGSGTLHFKSARVVKKKVTDVSASFNVVDDDIVFTRIHGSAYGGTIEGYLRINSKTTDLSGEFHVDRLELREFIGDTDSYANRALAGKINLDLLDLHGRGNDTKTLTGSGSMVIIDGQLFEVPGVARILSFGGFKRFDAGRLEFKIRDRKFDLRAFSFESAGGSSLSGRGDLTFDGDYDIRVRVSPEPLFGIGLFKPLSDILGALMRTRMTGNLESSEGKTEEVEK